MTKTTNISTGHKDRLLPSDADIVELSAAVQERFITVFEFHRLVKGVDLIHPSSIEGDLIAWRTMVARHRRGDLRNTQYEKTALRAIAQWTLDTNAELRNQPKQLLKWKD